MEVILIKRDESSEKETIAFRFLASEVPDALKDAHTLTMVRVEESLGEIETHVKGLQVRIPNWPCTAFCVFPCV